MKSPLDSFFQPAGIAIIGASSDPSKLGYAVARNLIDSGYPGAIHLVNPKGGRLGEQVMVRSIAEIPEPVALAVVIVPATAAPQALRELGERGVRSIILTSGGFREVGAAGAKLEAEIQEICRHYDLRLVGPNCVGLLDTHLPMDTTFLPPPLPARGNIAFLSHSGAFCAAVIDWSRGQGFGFSRMVSLGNQADLTETDLLPAITADPHTRTICMYLETISDGRKFYEAAREITPIKPVVVMKVGKTSAGQKAAASHTGALAGSETSLNAALEKAGVLRANSAEQLFDWGRAFGACPLPADKKVAILTSAGGPGVIAADALEAEGLALAELGQETQAQMRLFLPAAASTHNPVDMLASGSPQQYADCLRILLADPAVDAVLVITLPPPNFLAEDVADAIIPIIQSAAKPAIVVSMGGKITLEANAHFSEAGIPYFPFPERAASTLGALYRRALFLAQPPAEKFEVKPASAASATTDPESLIAAYDIQTSPLRLAANASQAREISLELGFPLVAKIASPDIPHKSDINGVILDLQTPDDVASAYETLIQRASIARPQAVLQGITLQRQIDAGQDVIIGALQDPQFGPVIMFGSGGVEAEGLNDVAFALAPLSEAEAKTLIGKTWAGRKLAGFRSIPPVDQSAVIRALVNLSRLAMEQTAIKEIEINPLRVLRQGAIAIDVRMVRNSVEK